MSAATDLGGEMGDELADDLGDEFDDDLDSFDGQGGGDPGRAFSFDDPERETTTSVALFEGDEGGLDAAQRRALVAVLKNRFITAASHPREWRALVANPRLIRARLHDLFLDLHLDIDLEVAYKRQVSAEGGDRFPTLLHDTAWTREETILLVYLRARSRAEQAAGATKTFVDRTDLLDHVAGLRPSQATDQAADGKRATRAIENLLRAGLLLGAATGDRFEISPAIDVLLPLEKLQDLLGWLRAQQGEPGEPAAEDRQPGDGEPGTGLGESDQR